MSDHSEPQFPNSFQPRSFEEIFGLGPDSQTAESQPPRSLEEIFGLEADPISQNLEDTDWFDFDEPQPQSAASLELERVRSSEVHQSELELPELGLSELVRQDRNLQYDEEMAGSGKVSFLSNDRSQGSVDPVNPPVMMDLNLNLDEPDAIPSSLAPEPVGESQLFEQASQGDEAAIRNLLNRELVDYGAAVVELELRGSLLQISVASDEVPSQSVITPLVQEAIASLHLIKIQKVSLYGQRHGSELPFWRSEFDPSDPTFGIENPEDELTLDELPPSDPFRFEGPDESVQTDLVEPELSHSELSQLDLEHSGLESPGLEHIPDEWPVVAKTESTETESTETKLTETEFASIPSNPVTDEGNGHLEVLVQEDFTDSWLRPLATEAPESRMIEPITTEEGLDSSYPESTPVDVAISLEKREAVRHFLERYADGERNFAHIDLSETDLSGINLTLADLHKGSFVWANLKDASLYHVNLSEAKLRHANLNGAKLRSANLQAADFLNADLKGADLSWSDLRGANLTGADLSDANLKNAILERVTMPDGTLLD